MGYRILDCRLRSYESVVCGWCWVGERLVLNLIFLACLFWTSSSGRFPSSEVMRGERNLFGLKLVSGRWLICEE